jgi:hypothetical protein
VKGQGRDVVGLAFAYQRVVLEEILNFGLVALGVGVKRSLCFGSIVRMEGKGGVSTAMIWLAELEVIRTRGCLRIPVSLSARWSHLPQGQDRRPTWVLKEIALAATFQAGEGDGKDLSER